MKKLILPLPVFFSFFLFSCEPEEMEYNPKVEIEKGIPVYSDTGNQSDPDDKKGDD